MNKHTASRLLLPFLFLITSLWGCYTVLKHPRIPVRDTEQQENAIDWERVSFGNDCHACHNSNAGMYHAMAVPAPRAVPSTQWRYYYETPWWFNYYAAPDADGAAQTSAEQSKRPFDRRQAGSAPEPNPGIAAPAAPTPATGSIAKPATSGSDSAPASNSTTENDGQKREGKRAVDSSESSRRTRKN